MTAVLAVVIVLLVVTPYLAAAVTAYRCMMSMREALLVALNITILFFTCWGAAGAVIVGYFEVITWTM